MKQKRWKNPENRNTERLKCCVKTCKSPLMTDHFLEVSEKHHDERWILNCFLLFFLILGEFGTWIIEYEIFPSNTSTFFPVHVHDSFSPDAGRDVQRHPICIIYIFPEKKTVSSWEACIMCSTWRTLYSIVWCLDSCVYFMSLLGTTICLLTFRPSFLEERQMCCTRCHNCICLII